MEYDAKRLEETLLALLAIFSFEGGRSWKGYDFDVMNVLHQQGLIDDPRGKNKSVWLTAEGLEKAPPSLSACSQQMATADRPPSKTQPTQLRAY